jgi:hypothetical protein
VVTMKILKLLCQTWSAIFLQTKGFAYKGELS